MTGDPVGLNLEDLATGMSGLSVRVGGTIYEILVPEGMMADIVRPLWDDEVIVTGIRRRKRIKLEDIVPVAEADNEFEESD